MAAHVDFTDAAREPRMTGIAARSREFLASRFGTELPPGAFATFLLRASHAGLEFLTLLVLAHLLGAAAFGVYAVAIACANVLGVPAASGFDRLLIREVAAMRAGERWDVLRGILRRATQIALASSLLLALTLIAVATWMIGDETLRPALWVTAVLLPLVAFARLRQAAVQGLGRVPAGLFPETVAQPVFMLTFAWVAFLVVGVPRTGAHADALQVVAAVGAIVIGVWLLRTLLPEQVKGAEPAFETARWLGSAMPLMWMLGMNMLLVNVDTIFMGGLLDEAVAGRYRVATQIAMLVGFPMTAINLAIAPVLARDFALHDLAALRRNTLRASRWALFAALPVALVLLAGSGFLLGLFGDEFVSMRTALVVLVLGWLANSFAGALGYLLIMTKHERLAAGMFTVAALANLVANYLLIPAHGALGAACATAGSLALLGIGFWISAYRLFFRRANGGTE